MAAFRIERCRRNQNDEEKTRVLECRVMRLPVGCFAWNELHISTTMDRFVQYFWLEQTSNMATWRSRAFVGQIAQLDKLAHCQKWILSVCGIHSRSLAETVAIYCSVLSIYNHNYLSALNRKRSKWIHLTFHGFRNRTAGYSEIKQKEKAQFSPQKRLWRINWLSRKKRFQKNCYCSREIVEI